MPFNGGMVNCGDWNGQYFVARFVVLLRLTPPVIAATETKSDV